MVKTTQSSLCFNGIFNVMKKYLVLRPPTTARNFSASAPRALLEGKYREWDELKKKRRAERLASTLHLRSSGQPESVKSHLDRQYQQQSTSFDPFAVVDPADDTSANAPDFLNQLERFNKGENIESDGRRPGRNDGVHIKRGKNVPVYMDETYRFLTVRDKLKYEREAPLLEAMRQRAREAQKEWAANQPPPPPPRSSSAPITSPSIPEPRDTPLRSVPTPRQLASLPQSPFLTPIPSFWSEKAYKMKSPAPTSEEMTPFQRKLHRNPYALTLASPVRLCCVTKQRLPRDFHISFESLPDPADRKAWFLPRDLSMPVPTTKLKHCANLWSKGHAEQLAEKAAEKEAENTPALEDPTVSPAATSTPAPPEISATKPQRTGSRYYILSSLNLFSQLYKNPNEKKSKKGATLPRSPFLGAWQIMNRFEREKHRRAVDAAWRPDMHEFVLKLMRERVIGLIWKGLLDKNKFVRYRDAWGGKEGIEKEKQMGAVLWLGNEELMPKAPVDDSPELKAAYEQEMSKEMEWGPGPYTLVNNPPFWEKKIPVLNVLRLLGAEGVKEIRTRGPPMDFKNFIVVKDKPDTVELRRWLLKIENYLAEFKDTEEGDLGKWTPRDDENDAGEDVEFETVYVPEDNL